jgi:PAS domain S-box-containing protein
LSGGGVAGSVTPATTSATPDPGKRRLRLHVVIALLSALFLVPAVGVQYWIYRQEEDAERRLLTASAYLGLVFLATAGVAFHLARKQERLAGSIAQSEESHRLLFDSSPLPLWVFDLETRRFLAVNEAAARHYGYTREEFLAMAVTDIRPPEDVPRFLELLAETGARLRGNEAWRHRKKDGSVIDVEIYSHRLTFAGRPASLVMVNDVSELRRHRQELQTLLDSMSTMVATVAPDGRLLQVNRTAQIASGLSPSELMATHFLRGPWWAFDAEVQDRVGRVFARACAGSPVSYEERILVFGQVMDISFSLNPVAGADGRVAYLVAEGRDVTPLKTAEAVLRQRSRELEALNQELEAFTYSVSHDLRSPLRAVAGFARILEEDHSSQLDADGMGYLRRIVDGARQMGALIDDLLNLSRIGRTSLERQPTELAPLVESVRRKVAQEAGDRRIEWRIQALPRVDCDERLIHQVFVNLLSNAVKYTRPRASAWITVGAEAKDGQALIFVRDNGVGFDMKYVHKLFGVFQRLHDSATFEGTGVGLATVQRIVHRHGGRIWAEAAPDQGATFYFTLDAAAAALRP